MTINQWIAAHLPYSLKQTLGYYKRRTTYKKIQDTTLTTYCNICHTHHHGLIPLDTTTLNSMCYVCASHSRHRLVWEYLNKCTNLFDTTSKKILHISPEYCYYQVLKNTPTIDYTAGDKFEQGYNYPTDVIDIDITNLHFLDDTFDAVICIHVLEHVPDDKKAMQEIYRVLKPNGWAILQVPMEERPDTFEDFTITDRKQ